MFIFKCTLLHYYDKNKQNLYLKNKKKDASLDSMSLVWRNGDIWSWTLNRTGSQTIQGHGVAFSFC